MTEPPAKIQRVEVSQEQSVKEEVKEEVKALAALPPYVNDPQYLHLLEELFKKKKIIVFELSKLIVGYRAYLEYLTHINQRLVELFFLQMNILPNEIYFNMIFKEAEYKIKLSIVEKRILLIENMCKEVLKKKDKFNSELFYYSYNYPLLYQLIKPFN